MSRNCCLWFVCRLPTEIGLYNNYQRITNESTCAANIAMQSLLMVQLKPLKIFSLKKQHHCCYIDLRADAMAKLHLEQSLPYRPVRGFRASCPV